MRLIFYFIILFCSTTIFSQINSITNERVFGGSGKDLFSNYVSIPNSDDTFLVASSNSNISGDKTEDSKGNYDIWLIKLDANNNIIWQKTIGGEGFDSANDATIIDSLLYITCSSNSPISGDKTVGNPAGTNSISNWVLCFDLNGNIVWQTNYGANMSNGDSKFLKLKNNNLLLAFSSSTVLGNGSTNSSNISLFEINPLNGAVITNSIFGSSLIDTFGDVIQMPNGELYVFAISQTGTSVNNDKTELGFGSYDYWVLKLTENFVKVGDKCFGGDQTEASNRMVLKVKNDFLYLVGTSNSGISGNKLSASLGLNDCWVVKTDLSLNYIWDKSYGGTEDDYSNFNFSNATGELLLSTISLSNISGNKLASNYGSMDCWVFRIDENGDLIDQASIGGSLDDYGQVFSSVNSPNPNFFAGTSLSSISGIKTLDSKGLEDIWLFNFNADELLSINETTVFGNISVFPNPFQDKVTFSFPEINEALHLKIFTLDGKTVYESSIEKNTLSKEVNLTDSKAIYFYEISGEKISVSGKLVKVN
jgi:hypothetical protein